MEEVILYDIDGQEYPFLEDEVEAMLETGTYFREKPDSDIEAPTLPTKKESGTLHSTKNINPRFNSFGLCKVYKVGSDDYVERSSVDARELVRTGKWSLKKGEDASGAKIVKQFPKLTADMDRHKIMSILESYGVDYHHNNTVDSLLDKWQAFLKKEGAL